MKTIDHHNPAQRLEKIAFQQVSGDMFVDNQLLLHTTPEPGETCWECPEKLGTGHFRRIILRQGFEIWINNCNFYKKTKFQYKNPPSVLEFSYIFSGSYLVTYGSNKSKEAYEGEHQGVLFMNNINTTCTVLPGAPIRSVSIHLLPELFFLHWQDNFDTLPPLLADVLKSKKEGIKRISRNSSKLRDIIDQIAHCSQKGLARKLFIESKALEFLFLQINALSDENSSPKHRIHPQDKQLVEKARTFLINNLEDPPCLCDLANSHGMSHPKLNRCFKLMYGMTVFQYLRYERMNRAKNMLEYEGLTVTETAFKVGYGSLSHFSQAYKKQFGVSPSRYNMMPCGIDQAL